MFQSMPRHRLVRGLIAATCAAACLVAFGAGPALAQKPASVIVKVGKSVTVPLPRHPQRLDIEDASVATMEVLAEGKVKVTGKKVGKTRIVGRDNAQVPIIIEVVVKADNG